MGSGSAARGVGVRGRVGRSCVVRVSCSGCWCAWPGRPELCGPGQLLCVLVCVAGYAGVVVWSGSTARGVGVRGRVGRNCQCAVAAELKVICMDIIISIENR